MLNVNKQEIFIDTDMGNDDIVAICLLISSGKFNVNGVSTVNGVSNPKVGAQNLQMILNYTNNNDIPVYSGRLTAIQKNWKATFPKKDCLRAKNLQLIKKLRIKKNKVDFTQIKTLNDMPNNLKRKVTLVCLGPLTNIAYLITNYKKIFISKIKNIVLMGGAVFTKGIVPKENIAEYNIFLDPMAAKIVFTSGIPITMVPVDATNSVPAMKDFIRTNNKENFNNFINSIKKMKKITNLYKIIKEIILNNNYDFNFFYDPLLAGIMIDKKIIKKKIKTNIKIIIKGKNQGQTKPVVLNKFKKITVIVSANSSLFYNLLLKLSSD